MISFFWRGAFLIYEGDGLLRVWEGGWGAWVLKYCEELFDVFLTKNMLLFKLGTLLSWCSSRLFLIAIIELFFFRGDSSTLCTKFVLSWVLVFAGTGSLIYFIDGVFLTLRSSDTIDYFILMIEPLRIRLFYELSFAFLEEFKQYFLLQITFNISYAFNL